MCSLRECLSKIVLETGEAGMKRKNSGITLVILILIIAVIVMAAVIVVPYILSIPGRHRLSVNKSNARQARTLASDQYHQDVAAGNVTYKKNDKGEEVLDGYYWYDSTQDKIIHSDHLSGDAELPIDIDSWKTDTLDQTIRKVHYTLGTDIYRYWVVTFNKKGQPEIEVSVMKGDTYTEKGY